MATFVTLNQAGGEEIALNVDWIAWVTPHPKERDSALIYLGIGRQYTDGTAQSPALILVEQSYASVRAALAEAGAVVAPDG